ncbi:MAG: Ig domain-containing protein [Clostridia bacterium]|nr:Ig domain-containing protein [Clostridia bacterium]
MKSGEAKITIKSSVSGKTSEISFTVRQKVESVEFSQEEYQFYVSNNVALSYRVNPSDAYNKAIVWNSSDESVVKVDENGMLTCLKAGKATITVTTVDGGHTATCVVTVID